jgi:hypothetical protein
VRHAGGAITRVDPQTAAYSNRDARHLLQLIGITPTPEAHQQLEGYVSQFKQALAPHLTGGVYMNFLEGEESFQRAQDGFSPEAYRRLRELKARYDPDNRFSFGFNIPPSKA